MTKLSLDELIIPAPPYRMARPVATFAVAPTSVEDSTQTREFARPVQENPMSAPNKPETITKPIEAQEDILPRIIQEARTLIENTDEKKKQDPKLSVLGQQILKITDTRVVEEVLQGENQKPQEAKPSEDLTAGMSETAKEHYLKAKSAGQNVTAYEKSAREQIAFKQMKAQKAAEADKAKKAEEARAVEEMERLEIKESLGYTKKPVDASAPPVPEVKKLTTVEEERESLIKARSTMRDEEYQRRLSEYNQAITAKNTPLPVEKAPIAEAPKSAPALEKQWDIPELEAELDRLMDVAKAAKKEGDESKASVATKGSVLMGQRIARMRVGSEPTAPEEKKPAVAPKENIDKQREEALHVEKMRELEKEQMEKRRAQPRPDLEDLDMRPRERSPDADVEEFVESVPLRSRVEVPVIAREKSGGIMSSVAELALRKTGAGAWLDTLMPRLKSVYHRQFAERRAHHQQKAQGSLEHAQEKFEDFKDKMDDSGALLKPYYAWRTRVWDKAIVKREGLVNRYDAFREKRVKRHNELQQQVADRYERELAPFRGKQEALKRDQTYTHEIMKTLETRRTEVLKLLTEAESKRKGIFGRRGKVAADKIRKQAKEIEARLNAQRKVLERIEKPLATATAKIQKYESRQKQVEANVKFLEMDGLKGIKRSKPSTGPRRTESSTYTTESAESSRPEAGHERDGEQWSAAVFAEAWNKSGATAKIEDPQVFARFVGERRNDEGAKNAPVLGELFTLAEEYFKANRIAKNFSKDKRFFLANIPKK